MPLTDAERAKAYRDRRRDERLAADSRRCPVCLGPMTGMRADALVCGDRCKVRVYRQEDQPQYQVRDRPMNRFKPGGIRYREPKTAKPATA